ERTVAGEEGGCDSGEEGGVKEVTRICLDYELAKIDNPNSRLLSSRTITIPR
ncbi:16199_t:CDS:2, partial [Acaulospora morrowiae]